MRNRWALAVLAAVALGSVAEQAAAKPHHPAREVLGRLRQPDGERAGGDRRWRHVRRPDDGAV